MFPSLVSVLLYIFTLPLYLIISLSFKLKHLETYLIPILHLIRIPGYLLFSQVASSLFFSSFALRKKAHPTYEYVQKESNSIAFSFMYTQIKANDTEVV
ncbi:hypothetical protein B0H16DRAFT_1515123 [Mycena metata]|uniref:Uncharacterized protein n=1 Tax=Mycena metata TaxID=1033252 RepID=A0AAD7IMK5_9AGAR|nr:hypothetical protein B0H16DRAFT_1556649 [Mycena metata]KAJ7771886.1 hypothetical protein B0H16DRAFT_1515123 [Mycena metata]